MKKLAYILALAIASSWTYAAEKKAAPAEKEAAKSTEKAADKVADKAAPAEKAATDAKTGVRKPTGDVNKFWNALNWDDLSTEEKKLWGVLGWNGRLWGAESGAPASESTVWDKLSKEEQDAASALGYDKKSWNQEE